MLTDYAVTVPLVARYGALMLNAHPATLLYLSCFVLLLYYLASHLLNLLEVVKRDSNIHRYNF